MMEKLVKLNHLNCIVVKCKKVLGLIDIWRNTAKRKKKKCKKCYEISSTGIMMSGINLSYVEI